MKRWTWVALVALIAILAVAYSLVARRHDTATSDSSDAELGVEPYDAEEVGSDAAYGEPEEMPSDTEQQPTEPDPEQAPEGASIEPAPSQQVETIEELDERGVTIQSPVVIDDEDTNIEVAAPKTDSAP